MIAPNADEVNRIFRSAPFIADLGLQLDSLEPGACTSVLLLEQRHLQEDGFVHAGVQATMADHTAGAAAATLLSPAQIVLTAEFKINLLRAAKGERLIGYGQLDFPLEWDLATLELECERLLIDGFQESVAKLPVHFDHRPNNGVRPGIPIHGDGLAYAHCIHL